MILIETHNPGMNLGLILIYHQVKYFLMATLSIVRIEKMAMVVFSLPAVNHLLHVV